jgi:hypothetical protein
MRILMLESAAELSDHTAAWQSLANIALEPNVFYEPWMLMPAIDVFGAGTRLQFLLIYTDPSEGAPVLAGFFPITRRSRYQGIPVRTASLWQHLYCFVGTPLIHKEHASECLDLFLDCVAPRQFSCALLEMETLYPDGPVCRLLREKLVRRGQASMTRSFFFRPWLTCLTDGETYVKTALSPARRQSLGR